MVARLFGRGRLGAFGAVILLVLQTFLTAHGAGAAPAHPILDAFGNPICITGTTDADSSSGDGHSGAPGCCTMGCAMSAAGPLPPVATAGEAMRPPLQAPISRDVSETALRDHNDHDPGNPRAPPALG